MFGAPLTAIAFLTRIPVPAVEMGDKTLGRSAGFFAWVGVLVAGACWACSALTVPLGPNLSALLCVAVWAWLTGGLHLDGLADTVDGLAGGRGRAQRVLEVMRDSRIGAHGAAALVLVLALKWAALGRILGAPGSLAWLSVPVVARWLLTLLVVAFPYARQQGLGSPFAGVTGYLELAVGGLALAGCAAWFGTDWLVPAAVGITLGLLLAVRVHRALGGLTGDVYGAALEVCEAGALVAFAWSV